MFSARQVHQLLQPINPRRVLQDPRGNSHVSQQDVTAHLIRVFGFGNFTTELLSCDLVYEHQRRNSGDELIDRWDVLYKATMRLTVCGEDGGRCSYENGSTGEAQNQRRADAHDLAMKSAISLSTKRCAINLGDQFGLSLYNKGQMEALVIATLAVPDDFEGATVAGDVQGGVPQQVSMGTDETVYETGGPTAEQIANIERTLGGKPVEEGAS
jgi:hypothetical protein